VAHRSLGKVFTVVLALAGLTWLALGAGMTFFADEWAFIAGRSLADPTDWFRPHNEHWSTLPIVAYRLLVETIGIGSYVPYQALVVLLHLLVAAMVYRLVERRSGPRAALLSGTLVAFFGAGFENIFWGFQTGFVGSMLLGLLALDVTDRGPSLGRAWGVAGLLVLSLMASGTGLVMCVAVGTSWLIDPGWRRYVGWLSIPAVAYASWLAAFGRTGVATMRNPFSLDAARDVPGFLVGGFGDAVAAITGLGSIPGVLAAAAIVAWAGRRLAGRSLPPLAGGALAAIAVQYTLIGLVRGGLIDGQVHYSRYTYESGILLLLATSALVGRPRRPESMPVRAIATALVISLAGMAFVYNGVLLVQGREIFLGRADTTRALLVAGLRRPLPPSTDPARSLVLVPSPDELERITAAYGDARTDHLVPFAVRTIPESVQAEADRRVRLGVEPPTAALR